MAILGVEVAISGMGLQYQGWGGNISKGVTILGGGSNSSYLHCSLVLL